MKVEIDIPEGEYCGCCLLHTLSDEHYVCGYYGFPQTLQYGAGGIVKNEDCPSLRKPPTQKEIDEAVRAMISQKRSKPITDPMREAILDRRDLEARQL